MGMGIPYRILIGVPGLILHLRTYELHHILQIIDDSRYKILNGRFNELPITSYHKSMKSFEFSKLPLNLWILSLAHHIFSFICCFFNIPNLIAQP